ncbi:hypothetical protein D1007_47244 [Hordeum vulgare]|nr:hypothetical protein D1007_47244 [Hordeum vulgare]
MIHRRPAVHGEDNLPFLKQSCVFVARRMADFMSRTADLCRFSMDGSAMLGSEMPSCTPGCDTAVVWIVPSLRNFVDWNEPKDNVDADML